MKKSRRPRDLTICYVGFGSNLGDRMSYCGLALEVLSRLPRTEITAVSSLYETEPVSSEGPWFLNGVVELSTGLSPQALLDGCQQIEAQMGRPRVRSSMDPRIIDLDLLLYGERVIRTPALTIPHPRMQERGFVLVPLAEIAPKGRHPILKKNFTQLLAQLNDTHEVKKIAPAQAIYLCGRS